MNQLRSFRRAPGFIPVRTFALRTDTRFSLSFARYPFMLATLALIFVDSDFSFCHARNIYLK